MNTSEVDVDRNPLSVFLSSKSIRTRYVYEYDLRAISVLLGESSPFTCPWGALRYEHTQAIRELLVEVASERTGKALSSATVNRILCALRGVLKTAWRLGQMSAEDYYRAVDVENVRGEVVQAGRQLDDDEVSILLDVCAADQTPIGIRDGTIIALMFSCGLRRSEVVNLDLVDYDKSTNELIVLGKRNKQRIAYLVNGASQAMDDWLKIRGKEAGPLFWSNDIFYGLVNQRMTAQILYLMLERRGKQAGVIKFSPHDLRRTFISRLLDAGVDISTVSKLAGHVSVTTTARYDRRPEITRRRAVELIQVPYHGNNGRSK